MAKANSAAVDSQNRAFSPLSKSLRKARVSKTPCSANAAAETQTDETGGVQPVRAAVSSPSSKNSGDRMKTVAGSRAKTFFNGKSNPAAPISEKNPAIGKTAAGAR